MTLPPQTEKAFMGSVLRLFLALSLARSAGKEPGSGRDFAQPDGLLRDR